MFDKVMRYVKTEATFKDPPLLENHVQSMPQIEVLTEVPNHIYPQLSQEAANRHARVPCGSCGGSGGHGCEVAGWQFCKACDGSGVHHPMAEVP